MTSTGEGEPDQSTPTDSSPGDQGSDGTGKGNGKHSDAHQKPDPGAYEGEDGNADATLSSPAPELPAPELPVPSIPLATPAPGRDVTASPVTATN